MIVLILTLQRVLSTTDFVSCSQSSSLLVSLRCDVTLDQSDLTFWSSDPSRDTESAWLRFSYGSTREVGSYTLQAIKTGFAQQTPSRWRLYAGLSVNQLDLVEERSVRDWKSLEQRVFTLATSIRAVHVQIEFFGVEFPVSGQNAGYSLTAFGAYPPVVFSFFTSEWSECSEPCDGGSQTREVACWGNDGRRDYPVADCEFSLGAVPATIQSCNTQPCLIPEITEVRARPSATRTDEISITCFPNSATDAQCITILATEERIPAYAEVTDTAVMLRACAPPSCTFTVNKLAGNTAYLVYCAVASVTDVEFQTVVGLTQPVFTAAANVSAVAVANIKESSLDVTVTLVEAMTAGVDISCTGIHVGYTLYPSGFTYLSSDVGSPILALRPDVSVQVQRCTALSCVLPFDKVLASGANYRIDCRSSAGKVVSSSTVTTGTASIQAMQYLSAEAGPKITLRLGLSSPSHVSCSLTPVSMLVCCPNAPQFVDFKLLPSVACGQDCQVSFTRMLNSTRYAVWCTAAPFTEASFSLFPADDYGFRFDTPQESSGVTQTTTTVPPQDLGPVREQKVVIVEVAGSSVSRSALIGAIVGVSLLVLNCGCTRSGRALYGLNPDGHSGPALPPSAHKLIMLDLVVLASSIINIIVISQAQKLALTTTNSVTCFFLGVSICLLIYQTVVLGLVQFLVSGEKLSQLDSIDLKILSKLHVPIASFFAAVSAGDAELEQAWATKATLLRVEVPLVAFPGLIALAVRGTGGLFGVLAILAMLAKMLMFCVTFTESVASGLDDEMHTDQIHIIANKREYGPTLHH